MEPPYNPAILLLDIYPKELKPLYYSGAMFIAAQLTITKLWKQPCCPSVDEWVKKMWYEDTMKFYSAMKKNVIISFAET